MLYVLSLVLFCYVLSFVIILIRLFYPFNCFFVTLEYFALYKAFAYIAILREHNHQRNLRALTGRTAKDLHAHTRMNTDEASNLKAEEASENWFIDEMCDFPACDCICVPIDNLASNKLNTPH